MFFHPRTWSVLAKYVYVVVADVFKNSRSKDFNFKILLTLYHSKQQENVHSFLIACEEYGCQRGDIFQSVDLTEDRNMPAVIKGIHALGRTVSCSF